MSNKVGSYIDSLFGGPQKKDTKQPIVSEEKVLDIRKADPKTTSRYIAKLLGESIDEDPVDEVIEEEVQEEEDTPNESIQELVEEFMELVQYGKQLLTQINEMTTCGSLGMGVGGSKKSKKKKVIMGKSQKVKPK